MAGQKFLQVNTTSGAIEENISTQSGGSGEENKIVSLDNSGKLDNSMMPTGFGEDINSVVAFEPMNAGDFVNVYYDGTATAVRVRKADATTEGKEANGFILSSITAGNSINVYFEGSNTALTGLDDGKVHFLSIVAGVPSSTPPTASGNIVQRLGRSISDTVLAFENSAPIRLA